MSEKTNGFKIEESKRQSWLSIAAVWAGGMICVPCLMIGGVLAGGAGAALGREPAGRRVKISGPDCPGGQKMV